MVLEGRTVEYDALILSIGSCANDFGTPGVAEHCLFIDNLVEANGFNEKFRMELLRAYAGDGALDIAIVGGGATGTQLAAELHKALELVRLHSFSQTPPALNITLLEAGPRILPAFPEQVSEAAQKELERIGVKVRTSAMVSGADENGFSLKDGSHVPATLRVWAAGVKAPEVTSGFGGLSLSRSGQILINPNLQTVDDPAIFAMGDCSYIVDDPLPPTAQVARQQAHHLARHLPAWLRDKREVPSCVFNNKGAIVALGNYNGWGTLPGGTVFGGGVFHGLSARLGHLALYRQHQIELYGLTRGLMSCFSDWVDSSSVRPSDWTDITTGCSAPGSSPVRNALLSGVSEAGDLQGKHAADKGHQSDASLYIDPFINSGPESGNPRPRRHPCRQRPVLAGRKALHQHRGQGILPACIFMQTDGTKTGVPFNQAHERQSLLTGFGHMRNNSLQRDPDHLLRRHLRRAGMDPFRQNIRHLLRPGRNQISLGRKMPEQGATGNTRSGGNFVRCRSLEPFFGQQPHRSLDQRVLRLSSAFFTTRQGRDFSRSSEK